MSGDSREVEITLPDTWDPPQLRGVRVRCSVAVNELFEWELPEVRTMVRVRDMARVRVRLHRPRAVQTSDAASTECLPRA